MIGKVLVIDVNSGSLVAQSPLAPSTNTQKAYLVPP